jgi:transposase
MKQYIGVDVGKNQLDIFDGKIHATYENTSQKIDSFIKQIKKTYEYDVIVLFEATGGYEQDLSESLAREGIPFRRVHPNKVRNYGKALGILAKTDSIDAKLIWMFGKNMEVEQANHLLSEEIAKLKAILTRRDQLIDEKVRELNRIDKLLDTESKQSIHRHVEWIDEELKIIEKRLSLHIKNHKEIKSKVSLYRSIKGIGKICAPYLVAFLPELGQLEDRKIAALVGVAPMNKDSGKRKGKRTIQGGRANLRKILYMAAVTASWANKDLKPMYEKLMSKGKLFKVAITAIMRKLVLCANTVAQRGTPWVIRAC